MSRAELLRPFADARIECPGVGPSPSGAGVFHVAGECPCDKRIGADTTIPDPRFAPLRGEHEFVFSVKERGKWPDIQTHICRHCGDYFDPRTGATPLCLRTDLDALMRVAAACGLALGKVWVLQVWQADGVWHAWLHDPDYEWETDIMEADTPEDAVAAALVAALPELAA